MASKKPDAGQQEITAESLGLESGAARGAAPYGAIDWARLAAIAQVVIDLLSRFRSPNAQAAGPAGSHDPQGCFIDLARLNFEAGAKALEHAGHASD